MDIINPQTGDWTLEYATAMLQQWSMAEQACAQGQQVTIDGRSVTSAHQAEITKRIIYWKNEIMRLQNHRAPGIRVLRPNITDF